MLPNIFSWNSNQRCWFRVDFIRRLVWPAPLPHMQKELLNGQMCKIKANKKLHQKWWFMYNKRNFSTTLWFQLSTFWTSCACHTHTKIADQTMVKVTILQCSTHFARFNWACWTKSGMVMHICLQENVQMWIMQTMTHVRMMCTPNTMQFTLKYLQYETSVTYYTYCRWILSLQKKKVSSTKLYFSLQCRWDT